jgi:hypothetical protein
VKRLLVAAAAVLLFPNSARATERSGVTIELGAGLGYQLQVPRDAPSYESKGYLGFAPPSLSLGAFVTSDLAIFVRTASISTKPVTRFETSSFVGVGAQYWATDRVFVALAGGLSVHGRGIVIGFADPTQTGFAIDARVGYAFERVGRHAFSIYGELLPAFYSANDRYIGWNSYAVIVGAEWQLGG